MSQLVLYENARAALAEARRIDEVKGIRDKAEAVRAYARMAKDVQLEMDAAELRVRAERRMGIMLAEMKRAGELSRGGRPKTRQGAGPISEAPGVTLDQLEIDKNQSSRAQKLGGIAERAFEAMVARMRERIASNSARPIKDTVADKKAQRSEKERTLAGKQFALPDRRYGVIYADPEWRFEPYSRESGMDRAADNHYPTSSTEAICARPVGEIAAKDCVLFLWATVPMLPDALKVMAAWGFAYKSHAIWSKDKVGTGYWFRNAHELLLVGTRGEVPAPAMGEQWASVIEGKVGAHSSKPARFYDLIEKYFPNLPKIELNARRSRAGWDAWGNEAPAAEGPDGGDRETAQIEREDLIAAKRAHA